MNIEKDIFVNEELERESISEFWEIKDDSEADWCLCKIKEAYAERDRIVKIAERKITELEEHIRHLNEKAENETSFLRAALQRYFGTVPHKEAKTQESYKLLTGSLVMRKAKTEPARPDKENEGEVIEYLKRNNLGELVKVSEAVAWAELKKKLKIVDDKVFNEETGEEVECISIKRTEPDFTIKL